MRLGPALYAVGSQTRIVDAGRLAAEHLVAVGRRRIAYVTGLETSRAAQDRLTGAGEALAGADIGSGIEYARCTLVARGSTVAGL